MKRGTEPAETGEVDFCRRTFREARSFTVGSEKRGNALTGLETRAAAAAFNRKAPAARARS